jgi:hypothetical protein
LAPLATGLILKTVWNRGTGAYHCPTGTCEHVRERLSEVLSLSTAEIPRTFIACKICTVVVPEVTRAGTANSTTKVTGNLLDGFIVLDTVTRVQSLVTETLSSSTTSAASGGTDTVPPPATATSAATTTSAVGIPRFNHLITTPHEDRDHTQKVTVGCINSATGLVNLRNLVTQVKSNKSETNLEETLLAPLTVANAMRTFPTATTTATAGQPTNWTSFGFYVTTTQELANFQATGTFVCDLDYGNLIL